MSRAEARRLIITHRNVWGIVVQISSDESRWTWLSYVVQNICACGFSIVYRTHWVLWGLTIIAYFPVYTVTLIHHFMNHHVSHVRMHWAAQKQSRFRDLSSHGWLDWCAARWAYLLSGETMKKSIDTFTRSSSWQRATLLLHISHQGMEKTLKFILQSDGYQ